MKLTPQSICTFLLPAALALGGCTKLLWEITYNPDAIKVVPYSTAVDNQGNLISYGAQLDDNYQGYAAYIVKYDPAGNKLWEITDLAYDKVPLS